jgi:hypothetical protein
MASRAAVRLAGRLHVGGLFAAGNTFLTDAPTRAGKTAVKYHTARFALVPKLCEELAVSVPASRGPWGSLAAIPR